MLSQTDPAGEVRSYTYDPRGSVATTTDERMHVTTSTTLPTSTSTTDALSNTTTNTQTDYGLPSSSTYPGGASTASAFNGLTHIDSSTSFPASQTDESSRACAASATTRAACSTAPPTSEATPELRAHRGARRRRAVGRPVGQRQPHRRRCTRSGLALRQPRRVA
ncbi:MAG: hypothetical protein H6674_10560 [Dehalococcoidia bacterium]|nr:hypothetical protein [Dehalococcoidia bacterium]